MRLEKPSPEIAVVRTNRPEVCNALDPEERQRLAVVFNDLQLNHTFPLHRHYAIVGVAVSLLRSSHSTKTSEGSYA